MSSPPVLDELRLRRLIDAGRSLIAKLDVEAVLQQLLDVAREVTGARYAAVGVLDRHREELERFVTAGIDPETHRAIGDLPRGRGILGLLIEDPRPLRLEHIGDHPHSYGFPSGHPEMETFLGVPVTVREEVWGNLYLTEKAGGRAVHRCRRGVRDHPRRLGRDRDRQRAALRLRRAAPRSPGAGRTRARHDGRDRAGARWRDEPQPHPRADRQARSRHWSAPARS